MQDVKDVALHIFGGTHLCGAMNYLRFLPHEDSTLWRTHAAATLSRNAGALNQAASPTALQARTAQRCGSPTAPARTSLPPIRCVGAVLRLRLGRGLANRAPGACSGIGASRRVSCLLSARCADTRDRHPSRSSRPRARGRPPAGAGPALS